MDKLFFDQYRREYGRLPGHDYASPGNYFITINTKPKILFFGKIINHQIQLSDRGKIIYKNWIQIPQKFEHIKLDAFVIMPDHIHGILTIDNVLPKKRTYSNDSNINKKGGITGLNNPMINNQSIPYVIRWFKARGTFQIRQKYPQKHFAWQSRFYDRIIKDKNGLYAAQMYIKNNPKKAKSG
jgi:putative transposase